RGKALGTLQSDTDEYLVREYSFPSAPAEIIYTLHKIPNHGISSHLVNANLDSFSGLGKETKDLKQTVSAASKTMANVLISGEPGTGKTLLARVIHNLRDPSRPFVHLDCSSLEKHDIGRALFGCLDSDQQERQGAFKQAEKGTLFIASIEQLPNVIQSKLVTTLISSLYTDMDNASQHSLKTRIIASTNADLPLLVEEGAFRSELFYLIDIIHVDSLPLRLQRNNFENILRQEMKRAALDTGFESFDFSPAALETLKNYSWPGNMHELRNLVMRLQCSNHQGTITPTLLPAHIVSCAPSIPAKFPGSRVSSSKEVLREQEAAKIRTVLRRNGGNKVECAAILGISRQTLYNRMKKYGINPNQEDGL
ncbi:MAG: sigma 54-interacting transcriptional regulator, partial [Akkermansia sp.]